MISGGSTSTCWYPMMNITTEDHDHHVHGNSSSCSGPESSQSSAASLFYSFSILKEKVHQLQSLVSLLLSTDQTHQPPHHDSTSIAIASMSNVIQELIVNASSMMFNCQQMSLGSLSATPTNNNNNNEDHHHHQGRRLNKVSHHPDNNIGGNGVFYSGETLEWFGDDQNCYPTATTIAATGNIKEKNNNGISFSHGVSNNVNVKESSTSSGLQGFSSSKNNNCDIIELDAADLLAKYTHYCQVCGKGFKRDANLRMHMRAHGDEYKTSAALSNPMKNVGSIPMGNDIDNNGNIIKEDSNNSMKLLLPRKYSCPQEGCRWNKKHAKFQPLKSMICVKNHYKRSHCPKMYMCKRCNRKQFSVLSDLKTHEKHCGDLKWQCSCGTTFSRKDKLMGHVALFIGHIPVPVNNISAVTVTTTNKPRKIINTSTDHNQSSSSSQMQLDSR